MTEHDLRQIARARLFTSYLDRLDDRRRMAANDPGYFGNLMKPPPGRFNERGEWVPA